MGDPVTRFEVRHPIADHFDHTCRLHANHGRQTGQRIRSHTMINVDKIETGNRVVEAYLPRTRIADPNVFPFHDLRSAGFMNTDGLCSDRHI